MIFNGFNQKLNPQPMLAMKCTFLKKLLFGCLLLFISATSIKAQDARPDLSDATILCDKRPMSISAFNGPGTETNEADSGCLEDITETNTTWFTWEAATDGLLNFNIQPDQANDLFSFSLFQLPNGLSNGTGKVAFRCTLPCRTGSIGLRDGDNDFVIDDCADAPDGFMRSLSMETGLFYGLMIENTTSDGGFTITFSGDGEFVGPVGQIIPDNSAVCFGEEITFDNDVTFTNGTLTQYSWIFEDEDGSTTRETMPSVPQDFTFQSNGNRRVELTVTTDIGCTAVFDTLITINDCCESLNQITIDDNPVISEIACPDDTNGAIDITVNNASAFPPIFAWSNGATTQNLSMLPPDTYTVTVTNAAGCRDSLSHEFVIPNALEAVEIVSPPSCGGIADGIITINVSGGRTPYEYDFGNDGVFVSDSIFDNLVIGDYVVVVRDASGCTNTVDGIELDERQLNITQGAAINPTCNGDDNGSIDIMADNAVGLLTFDFNNGNGPLDATSITRLEAGVFSINVFDSEGCTANTVDFTLTEPDAILSSIEGRPGITCAGANDGVAIVTATGGDENFTYEWSTGETTRSIANLAPGVYTVTITDGNDCTDTNTITLNEPDVLTATVSNINNVTCSGRADGSIELAVNGGTMPYRYTLDGINFENGTTLSGLVTGDYNITVSDNNDCTAEVTETISSPASLSFTTSSDTDICYGEPVTFTNSSTFTQGIITDVSWNFGDADEIGPSVNTSFTTIGNPTVALTVTTDLGCTETLTRELDIAVVPCCEGDAREDNAIFSFIDQVDALCNGGSDGSANLNISSPAPVTAINWSNGLTEENVTDLPAGNYDITVTNDATCSTELFVVIGEPSLIVPTLTITEPTCDAASNGEITVSASGGTVASNSNYDFDFGDGIFVANPTFDDLGVDNYTISVRDDNDCIVSIDTFLAVPDGFNPIMASLEVTTPTCAVATNGSITVNVVGDGRPVFFDFGDGPSTENTLPNLGVGMQSVVIQDLDNCMLSLDTILLVAPDAMPIEAEVQINAPSCTEAANGSITILATGNGGPFLYDFGDGDGFLADNSAEDLIVGNYSIIIVDGDNCMLDIDTSLSVPADAMPVQATLQIVEPSCGGLTDGSVTVLPSGELGTDISNYTFDFGNGFIDSNIDDNLGNGNFFAVVRNANNCSILLDTFLNELVLMPNTPVVVRPTCFGLSDGIIMIDVPAPGEGPFTFNFLDDTNGFQDETALMNLPEGTYTIQVQDNNLCLSDTLNVVVNQPDELMLTLESMDISCFGENDGQIIATVTGGVGNNSFNWSDGQTTSTAVNLMEGDYTLDVTDGNDCPISSDNAVTIIEPAELSATIGQIDNVLCFGEMNGAVTISPMGGSAPYEYSLDGIIFQPDATLGNLVAGDYTVIVRDSRDCEISTESATVDEPGEFTVAALVDNPVTQLGFPIILSADPNTTAIGGINYTWTIPDSIICTNCQIFETIPPGSTTYTVNAVNADNCFATASVDVAVSTDRPIFFPNIFSPNGDGVNDEYFIPFSPAMTEVEELKIFSRNGSLVFEAFNIRRGEEIIKSWDGEFNGQELRQGVFVVVAQIKFVDDQSLPFQSDVTIITSE